jgi:hypothetical protein
VAVQTVQASRFAKKGIIFVIPSEARNLSERFARGAKEQGDSWLRSE